MSWWDENEPQTGGSGAGTGAPPAPTADEYGDTIRSWYQTYLGRAATPQEVEVHRRNPGGSPAVEKLIKESEEAKRYAATKVTTPTTGGAVKPPPAEGWQAWFASLTNGKAPTPAELTALGPLLAEYGVTLAPNAAGINGKVKLPNGTIVDVIQNAGSGGSAWQWLDTPGGGGSDPTAGDPWGGTWNYKDWTPPPEFVAPDAKTVLADQGFQARLKEGTDALQRSAASKGTLLTGGTLKGLTQFASDYASNEYQNVYNRAKGAYDTNLGVSQYGYGTNRANAKDVDTTAYDRYMATQNNSFDRLYKFADINLRGITGSTS